MPDPLLKLHDKGVDVIEAQGLLNRNGAILDPDGDFGKGTEAAVREFQAAAGLRDSGTIDAATWQRLRGLPEPSPDIPTRAVAFIAREEVGSRGFYDAQCVRPTWPGGASGVTIGVGYDLGYQAGFAADWSDLLTPAEIARLTPWLGRKGQAAKAGPAQLTDITIPWHAAWMAFIRRTCRRRSPTRALPSPAPCPCRRSASACSSAWSTTGVRAWPTRLTIPVPARRCATSATPSPPVTSPSVPAALRAMKRLWPEGNGLRERREREAKLFEEGL